MPTTNVHFRWVAPHKIDGIFEVEGQQANCALLSNVALPNLGEAQTRLIYDNMDQLTGTRKFDGHVGRSNFAFSFENGPRIEGDLLSPIVEYITVNGTGTWVFTFY
ncbi:hypothetical protein BDV39DRAFT_173817 [Aspergillus sergii]|uniref:Uncharacterized protein n=1 Tax=Aspergillus sergii TaxID=1034303 RepID=A0A5N6X8M8_9EURO|nr:hypothetical protein BDV39DRAFT_173817 [Aspergillus sergii]